jgi:hypothetical protein
MTRSSDAFNFRLSGEGFLIPGLSAISYLLSETAYSISSVDPPIWGGAVRFLAIALTKSLPSRTKSLLAGLFQPVRQPQFATRKVGELVLVEVWNFVRPLVNGLTAFQTKGLREFCRGAEMLNGVGFEHRR